MRIEAYNHIAQVYGTKSTNSKAKVNQTSAYGKDEVSISSYGKDLQVAKQAVKAASDVRTDKVNQLKSQIESGNYSVDVDDFASILMEKFQAKF